LRGMSMTDNMAGQYKPAGMLTAAAVLFALTLLAYSNSFNAGFHFDDFHQTVNNKNIADLANLPRFFVAPELGSAHHWNKGYRPVTHGSFAVSYALAGGAVWGYHAVNFLLHFINALLVFILVGSVLKRSGHMAYYYTAMAASAIFAVHPIETSAVTYISGRAVLLATSFYLMSFLAFIRYREHGGYGWAAAAPLLYMAGLLSKEMAVSLPVMMFAYDVLFTAKPRRAWLYYTPFIAAFMAYIALRRAFSGFVTAPELPFGTGEYLMSEAKALLLYVRLLIMPVNQNVDYNLPPTLSIDPMVVFSAVAVAASLVWLFRLRAKSPAVSFFGLWFFVALAPESTLVPITDIAVEYRLYLPSVGFIAAVVVLAEGLMKRRETLKKAVAFPLIAMFLILSMYRNCVWADEERLWSDAAKKSPYSLRAHVNLGTVLSKQGRYAEAAVEYRRSIEIDPLSEEAAKVSYNLGVCLSRVGRTDDALDEFRRTVRIDPGFADAYANAGAIYYDAGRYKEAEEALRKAVFINPASGLSHLNLGLTYWKLARLDDAQREMEAAVPLMPGDFDVRYNLALVYNANGHREKTER